MTSIIIGFFAITAVLLAWGLVESIVAIDIPSHSAKILARLHRHPVDDTACRIRAVDVRPTTETATSRAV